jgi:hypothetical protein
MMDLRAGIRIRHVEHHLPAFLVRMLALHFSSNQFDIWFVYQWDRTTESAQIANECRVSFLFFCRLL